MATDRGPLTEREQAWKRAAAEDRARAERAERALAEKDAEIAKVRHFAEMEREASLSQSELRRRMEDGAQKAEAALQERDRLARDAIEALVWLEEQRPKALVTDGGESVSERLKARLTAIANSLPSEGAAGECETCGGSGYAESEDFPKRLMCGFCLGTGKNPQPEAGEDRECESCGRPGAVHKPGRDVEWLCGFVLSVLHSRWSLTVRTERVTSPNTKGEGGRSDG